MQAPGEVPEVVEFCRALSPTTPYHKTLRALHAALSAVDPAADLLHRQQTLENLVAWIRDPAPPPVGDATGLEGGRAQDVRLALVLESLESVPTWRSRITGTLAGVLLETRALHLFAEVGVPSDRGFLDETLDRVAQKLLPHAREIHDLADVVGAAFPHRRDAEWLRELPPPLLERLLAVVPAGAWSPLERDLGDAVRVIATRVAALGLSEELRSRSTPGSLDDSPFHDLPRVCELLVAGQARAQDVAGVAERCRSEGQVVRLHLERAGVSVDIVYRLDAIRHCLTRLELLAPLVDAKESQATRRARLPGVLATMVLAGVGDLSFARLLSDNTRLLAEKIIDRVGSSGEHYITRSRRDWWHMLRSAGGGGVLTAFTAALKYIIGWWKLPIFVEGIVNAINYSTSFVIMQLVGFTLATKQPSMTAAALASALRSSDATRRVTELVGLIARLTRSQLAAALGNVGMVIPTAFAFDQVWYWRTQQHFLDLKTAEYVVQSLHPLESPVIWFATLTGVFLWLASLGAGWLENWTVYRRLPEAIEQHRLGHVFGRKFMLRMANHFRRQIAGFGGSVTLGTLLGIMPVLGKGFGVPIGVAHVTLSAGALTFAGCALGLDQVLTRHYGGAAIGVACVGLLNFGVSFLLALWVALRARSMVNREKLHLVRELLARFLRRPWEFFFPPKAEKDSETIH